MKVLIFVKATAASEAGLLPNAEAMREMGRYNDRLSAAKIIREADGLKPTSAAVRVRFSGTDRTVINGPFAEANQLVAGYWIWDVKSMEEALEWVLQCPNPMPEDSEIEIRPAYGAADLAEIDPAGAVPELANTLAARDAVVRPYLFYGGRCEEALEFYKHTLAARVGMVVRFNESPDPPPAGLLQPGFETKIRHSEFTVGNHTIMASDGCGAEAPFAGFSLSLAFPTPDAADRAFNALAVGGKVNMPLAPTFWSPRYGQVTDKFGVGWMVMVQPSP